MALIDMLDQVYQAGNGLWQELKQRDTWVYCVSKGNLPQQGGSLSVHYFGRKRFADDFLMFYDRDAVDAAVQQDIEYSVSLPKFLAQRHKTTQCPENADILIVDHLFEMGGMPDAETLAPHLNAMLPVQPTIDAQLEMIRSKGHRRKLQAAIKRGITWRRTHSLADFNLFYDVMYEPFVHERFRYGASIVARDAMQRMFVQRGFLLLVEEDGVPVSGALIYTSRRDSGVMCYWKYGLAGASELSANAFGERNAAQEACVLQYAIDNKFRDIDWGLTKAVPTDGIFTHKKRMGCDYKKTPNAPDFRIHINPQSRGRLLSRFPLIISQHGKLQARLAHETPVDVRNSLSTLSETLHAAAFASLSSSTLYVPQTMLYEPQIRATCDAVVAETNSPITIESL